MHIVSIRKIQQPSVAAGWVYRYAIACLISALTEVGSCHVPNLPTSHVPNLTSYVPNLTGASNVPKIEQCLKKGSRLRYPFGDK
jgi:hypothetical protein